MEQPLIIRGSLGKQTALALGGLAFIVVGCMMLTLQPPENSVLGWSTPVGRAAQIIVGILAVLLGVAVLGVLIYAASRPILRLYPDRLIDARRKLEVPFAEIREMTTVSGRNIGSAQWLLLQMRDPGKYAGLERLSKRSGLTAADLTLDLTLASTAAFERARQHIQARLSPAGRDDHA